jgi:hypothetical protein
MSPLPESYLAAIRKHPISKLTHDTSEGKGLFFFSPFLTSKSGLDKIPALAYWAKEDYLNAHTDWKGELKQSKFLGQILYALFSEAMGSYLSPDEVGTNSNRVVMDVFDPHGPLEGSISLYEKGDSMEMGRLKAANPEGVGINKAEARKHFNLGSNKKIFSLYVTDIGRFKPGEWQDLMTLLNQAGTFDAVIVSTGRRPINKSAAAKVRKTFSGVLTDWQKDPEKFPAGAIILNNTTGQMSMIHAMSEAAIVIGPINWFEPLVVNTPTIIYVPEHFRENFELSALRSLVAQAERTGGARRVNSLGEIVEILGTWMHLPPKIILPGLTPDSHGKTPFDKLLDDLDAYLRSRGVEKYWQILGLPFQKI